jgi:hypothetical protein
MWWFLCDVKARSLRLLASTSCVHTPKGHVLGQRTRLCSKFEPAGGAIMQWATPLVIFGDRNMMCMFGIVMITRVSVWDVVWFWIGKLQFITHCFSLSYVSSCKGSKFLVLYIQNLITNLLANCHPWINAQEGKGRQISDILVQCQCNVAPTHMSHSYTIIIDFQTHKHKAKMNYSNPQWPN